MLLNRIGVMASEKKFHLLTLRFFSFSPVSSITAKGNTSSRSLRCKQVSAPEFGERYLESILGACANVLRNAQYFENGAKIQTLSLTLSSFRQACRAMVDVASLIPQMDIGQSVNIQRSDGMKVKLSVSPLAT